MGVYSTEFGVHSVIDNVGYSAQNKLGSNSSINRGGDKADFTTNFQLLKNGDRIGSSL
jgi:hypothetical protein